MSAVQKVMLSHIETHVRDGLTVGGKENEIAGPAFRSPYGFTQGKESP